MDLILLHMYPLTFMFNYWMIFMLTGCCCGNFNLFMNETETKRILGIGGELYYVRNNVINDYALSFNVPIKPTTDVLYFTWQHLTLPKSHMNKMRYNMSLTVSNEAAMKPPVISLLPRGTVPTQLQVFSVSLVCTHVTTAEINVVLTLNVTMFNLSHPTSLQIRRKKTCIKEDTVSKHGDYNPNNAADALGKQNPQDGDKPTKSKSIFATFSMTSTKIFYICISGVCLLIILVAVIVVVCYLRSHRLNTERLCNSSSSALAPKSQYSRVDTPNTSMGSQHHYLQVPPQQQHLLAQQHPQLITTPLSMTPPLIRTTQPPGVVASSTMRRPLSALSELDPQEIDSIIHQIHIDRKKLSLGEILMEGTFGKIYRGTMLIEMEKEKSSVSSEMDVYVKTVTDAASVSQIDTLLREGCALRAQIHSNINAIIATCLEPQQPPMLIYPFLSEGNLKKFLHRSKIGDLTSQQSLSTQQLVYMATQVCRGVQFLHRKRIIHRDIATRNCVIDHNLTVKVSDRGLSRDLFPADYHCLGDNENRPIKWMSIEALIDSKYSYSSDVWSFGVTLWEILSVGQQPYADVDPFEMAAYLREGYRVSQPASCPDELFAVMACCWALNPDERPSMAQLQVCMQDFFTALGRFI